MAKLEGCMALAVVRAQDPVAVIQNLTQEALQHIDTAMRGVAACLGDTRTIMCLVNVVGHTTGRCE
jgi:ABC-type phosphate transport system permease subunit